MSVAPVSSSSSSSSTLPSTTQLPLARSPSLDILAARRCWSKIDSGRSELTEQQRSHLCDVRHRLPLDESRLARSDLGSSGFVSAHDLQQYLNKFLAQQKRFDDPAFALQNGTKSTTAADASSIDHEEEQKSSGSSTAAAAANSSSSLNYRARALCQAVSQISQKDLDDLILFADCNGDSKLDLDEYMQAYSCFTHPPVSLTTERFESAIIEKGLAGARPPPPKIVAPVPTTSTASSNGLSNSVSPNPFDHPLLGTGAVLGFAPPSSASSTSSPGPPKQSTVPKLPSIFMQSSLPLAPSPAATLFESPTSAMGANSAAASSALSPHTPLYSSAATVAASARSPTTSANDEATRMEL